MKFLQTIVGTSYDCTAHKPDRSPVFVLNKLGEEICELSDVFQGIAASEPLNGEVADVIISAVDLLYVVNYDDVQMRNSMTKEEMLDTVINHMGISHDVSPVHLEEDWFRLVDRDPQKHLNLVLHYHGRIIRLCNQPYRSQDVLSNLVDKLIMYTARMACAEGALRCVKVSDTRVKVEHAVEHKVGKWRTKFGL